MKNINVINNNVKYININKSDLKLNNNIENRSDYKKMITNKPIINEDRNNRKDDESMTDNNQKVEKILKSTEKSYINIKFEFDDKDKNTEKS